MSERFPKNANSFRVIHTADWHLGKFLSGLSREEEHSRFLEFLLKQIQQNDVDALVISGDVFDSANPPQSAQQRYYTFLSQLYLTTQCSVVIIGGNHDSPAQLEAPRRVLNTLRVHVIGAVTEDLRDAIIALPDREHPKLVVAAVPYLRDRDVRIGQAGQSSTDIQKEITVGIQKRYQEIAAAATQAYPAVPILATGHLTVTGTWGSESERDIHIGGLGAVGVDVFPETLGYVALGHLHRPQAAEENENVRYSGSPIPLSFSEAEDCKEVRLLDFDGDTLVSSVGVPIPVHRHLVQLSCARSELPERLRNFQPPAAELPTWVEVIVSDPVAGEALFEFVQEAARDKPWQVIRVVQQRSRERQALTEADISAPETNVLENPGDVFEIRLEQQDGLLDDERAALRLAFLELLNLHHERQREEEAVPVEVAA